MSHTAAARAATRERDGSYRRHRPEQTLLYRIVEGYYPVFTAHLAEQGGELPSYVRREFENYLKCGHLEHGFLRCVARAAMPSTWSPSVANAVAFTPGILPFGPAFGCSKSFPTILCPSCGARRMAESAALLVDEVPPEQPMRQWVLSFPFQLRFPFGAKGTSCGYLRNRKHPPIGAPP